MSKNFRFKQFEICQDKCAMKVGTDGVLLGAWANLSNVKNALDIGCGTGLLSLMMAQRSDAIIDAVEIDYNAFCQAQENFNNSKWNHRINLYHQSIQQFAAESNRKYDFIISNPPYFQNAFRPNDDGRFYARHNVALPFDDLLKAASSLIQPGGTFSVILPTEAEEFINMAVSYELHLVRKCNVYPNPTKPAKRLMLDFKKLRTIKLFEENLVIEQEKRHEYTAEYIELTKAFYLKM
jgi:tRNA1Val (adenine37-N6)-methyltransferase